MRYYVIAGIALLAVASVLTFVSAPAANASSGYRCVYADGNGDWVSVSGRDNAPAFCRAFNTGFAGHRVGYAGGVIRCSFMHKNMDIRVFVWSRERTMGRAMCLGMREVSRSAFYFSWA
jgi:hypothetical protein